MAMVQTANVITVNALGEEHARRIACAQLDRTMEQIARIETLRVARPAKTCTTNDFPVKGTRKWITTYNIYTYAQKIKAGRGKFIYTHMELVEEGFETKTEATKVAREMAVKHHLPMMVEIAKELENDSPYVLDTEPKATAGQYRVTFK